MDKTTQTQIIKLIHQEVIPAIGCTEPVAVALAAAKAAEVLGCKPEKTEVFLSANILKNAMGVGIPGTGMVGLPIAIALGTLIGKSAYGLEVLRDLTPEALAEGKQVIEDKRIHIALKDNVDKLYIEVICSAGDETSRVIICHEHTNVVYVEKNGVVLTDRRKEGVSCDASGDEDELRLSFSTVYEFAMEMPLDEIRFILETADLNRKAAELIDNFIEKSETDPVVYLKPLREEEKAKAASSAETNETGRTDETTETNTIEEEDDSCFTETLAKIYVKQQRYSKALEIIKKLSLKYPKKNAYFADQIRFLEKLIINANSK